MPIFPSIAQLRLRRQQLDWYFDKATDAQRNALRKIGSDEALQAAARIDLSKGEASDVIGALEPCDEFAEGILTFFGLSSVNYTDNDAQEMIRWLMEHQELWSRYLNRPLDDDELDYFRLLNIPEPFSTPEAREQFEEARHTPSKWKRFIKLQNAEQNRIQKIVFDTDRTICTLAFAAEDAGIAFEADQEITLSDDASDFVRNRIREGEFTGHAFALFEHLLDRHQVKIHGDIETLYRLTKNPRMRKKLVSSLSPS